MFLQKKVQGTTLDKYKWIWSLLDLILLSMNYILVGTNISNELVDEENSYSILAFCLAFDHVELVIFNIYAWILLGLFWFVTVFTIVFGWLSFQCRFQCGCRLGRPTISAILSLNVTTILDILSSTGVDNFYHSFIRIIITIIALVILRHISIYLHGRNEGSVDVGVQSG